MDFKEHLKTLVETLEAAGLSKEDQSKKLNKGKNYISDLLTPTGNVTPKIVDNFKIYFKEQLGKTVDPPAPVVVAENDNSVNSQALLKLANANEKLADANQRLTIMLERKFTASDAQQMIEGALARQRAIQEVLQVYAKEGKPINVERFEADVNTRIDERARNGIKKERIQNDSDNSRNL